MWKRNKKWEKSPRLYLKKNRRLCTQLFEISRLLFDKCLLSSATINIHRRLHILADFTRATDVVVGVVKDAPIYSDLVPIFKTTSCRTDLSFIFIIIINIFIIILTEITFNTHLIHDSFNQAVTLKRTVIYKVVFRLTAWLKKSWKLGISLLLSMYIISIAQVCQILFSSILKGMVPNQNKLEHPSPRQQQHLWRE